MHLNLANNETNVCISGNWSYPDTMHVITPTYEKGDKLHIKWFLFIVITSYIITLHKSQYAVFRFQANSNQWQCQVALSFEY